jgi:hypothetical protein
MHKRRTGAHVIMMKRPNLVTGLTANGADAIIAQGFDAAFSRPRFIDAAFPVGDEDAHVTLRIKD